jgi:2-polyprenyl-3-methyl-5-hydroxy-6-metoxy-1,4-benzoquinol methylase/glycosyltransferase involved in cell wall biosynthesis
MNVLLFPSPVTDLWTRAFRREHSVLTAGVVGTGTYDVYYHGAHDTVSDLMERLPRAWQPDFCFVASVEYYDFPLGLEDAPIPTVAVFSDYNLCFDLMRRAAQFLDLVIVNDDELVEPLRAHGANRVVALPWFALDEETFRPLACEKVYDLCFVGNLNPHVQRQRTKLLEARLRRWFERYRVFVGSAYGEDYVRLLNQSKIVFNQSIRGDLNMRVFETMGCRALAILEDVNAQAKRFFQDGEHIVYYNEENLDDLLDYYLTHDAERERIAIAGHAEVRARHTYAHRVAQIVSTAFGDRFNRLDMDRTPRRALSPLSKSADRAAVLFYLRQFDAATALCRDGMSQPDAPPHLWNDVAVITAHGAQASGQFTVGHLNQVASLLQRAAQADAANPLPHFHLCLVAHWRAATSPLHAHAEAWQHVSAQWREFITHFSEPTPDVDLLGLPMLCGFDRFRLEWERALLQSNPRRLRDLLLWKSYEFLGDALAQLQNWTEAQAAYRHALEVVPDNGYLHHKLGQARQRAGDVKDALVHYERAIACEPFFFAAQCDLAHLLAQCGRADEAAAVCRDALRCGDLPLPQELRQRFEQLDRALNERKKTMMPPPLPTLNPQRDLLFSVAHAFEGAPEDVRAIQQRFAAYFRAREKVLDIGCGQGVFMELLRDRGCQVEGVDIDPAMVALAAAKGLTVHRSDILTFLERCENAYDGIYAANIIEHFNGRDATEMIQRCARALKPDGVLVIVTANFRHPLMREEVFWLDITHVRPYPIPLIAKMMEAVGLTVADAGACPEGLNDIYVAGKKPLPLSLLNSCPLTERVGNVALISREAAENTIRYRCDNMREDVIAEIADYTGESPDAVRQRFEQKEHDEALCQQFRPPQTEVTSADVERLYDSRDYVYHLMETPLFLPGLIDRIRLAVSTALHFEKKTFLDFGAGVGRDGIAFARFGFDCTHADLPGAVRDFAAWRYAQRGLNVHVADTRNLPDRRFDVVLCCDVLEHVFDPVEVIAKLCAHLEDDGLLFVFGDWLTITEGDLRHLPKNAVYFEIADGLFESAGLKMLWDGRKACNYALQIFHRPRGAARPASARAESRTLDAQLTQRAHDAMASLADHPEPARLQAKLKSQISNPDVLWQAPLFDPSGYADEARHFVLGLDALGVRVQAKPIAWSDRTCDLDERTSQRLQALMNTPLNGRAVHVQHIFPPYFRRESRARRFIGRTMFETDRIPADWVDACNAMDEIWVPTPFNVETFARSGVREDKLFIVPGPLDSQAYDVNVAPLEIPERRGFNFLSVFDWSLRKGWDVLLRAFVEEFAPDEDVALLLKVYSSYGSTIGDIHERVTAFITEELRRDVKRVPDIVFIEDLLPAPLMPRLFKTADAYVMPSRCEGWGRPLMEAMAMGLPTIGTRWSGNTEFMNDDNSYLVEPADIVDVPDCALREAPTYRGHRWAEPSVEHLRQLIRRVFEHRDEARAKGARARQDVTEKYDVAVVCRKIAERLASE